MIRDKNDERTIKQFVTEVCASGNWRLRFYVTLVKDVKNDPDAEPDARYTYEGAARNFYDEMLKRDNDVLDILDEKIMQVADDIRCDFNAETLDIYILY